MVLVVAVQRRLTWHGGDWASEFGYKGKHLSATKVAILLYLVAILFKPVISNYHLSLSVEQK